jgi:hypothetical protein
VKKSQNFLKSFQSVRVAGAWKARESPLTSQTASFYLSIKFQSILGGKKKFSLSGDVYTILPRGANCHQIKFILRKKFSLMALRESYVCSANGARYVDTMFYVSTFKSL